MVLGASATVTLATGATVTVIDDVPDFPSLVAVTVAVPAATAVATPSASTVATAVLLELHATTRPFSVAPPASLVTAVNCCAGVMPRTSVADDGLTVTVATGTAVAVSCALPVFPSLVAMMFAVPGATAVTTPLAETVAADVLSEVQLTVRPVRMLPLASLVVAVA
jgi:hypothetical protein